MKVLAFVVLACIFYTLIVTYIFRTQSIQDRAALMTRVYITSLVPLYFAYKITPVELGFLPSAPAFVVPNDFVWFFVPYTAAIFGGILQLYNLTERGFSLRILIDILSSAHGVLDEDEVMHQYSEGKGIDWLFQKRIDDLREQSMIQIQGERVFLTRRGRLFGIVYLRLKKTLGLPLGG